MGLGFGIGGSEVWKWWGLGFEKWFWEEIRVRRRRWEDLVRKRASIVERERDGEEREESTEGK